MDKRTKRRLDRIRLSKESYAMSYLATENGSGIQQDMEAACTPVEEEQSQYE